MAWIFQAKIANSLNGIVQMIWYHCVIPCIVNHSFLICFIIHQCISYLQWNQSTSIRQIELRSWSIELVNMSIPWILWCLCGPLFSPFYYYQIFVLLAGEHSVLKKENEYVLANHHIIYQNKSYNSHVIPVIFTCITFTSNVKFMGLELWKSSKPIDQKSIWILRWKIKEKMSKNDKLIVNDSWSRKI